MKQLYLGNKEELKIRIWALDLNPLIVKLMDEEEGEGWTLEQAKASVEEYRRFLLLTVTSKLTIPPTKFVDSVWHAHILDTMKYAEDCQSTFGFFLHHFPYFGLRGAEDNANLQQAFRAAASVYEAEFKTPYYVGIDGASCGTCGSNSCGSCAGSGVSDEVDIVRSNERPQPVAA